MVETKELMVINYRNVKAALMSSSGWVFLAPTEHGDEWERYISNRELLLLEPGSGIDVDEQGRIVRMIIDRMFDNAKKFEGELTTRGVRLDKLRAKVLSGG